MEKIVCGGNYTTNLIKDNINELIDENVLVKGDVTTLQSDVGTLQTDVTALDSDVSTLQTDTVNLRGDVDPLKVLMSKIKVETPPTGFNWPAGLPDVIAYKNGDSYSCNLRPEDLIDFSVFTNTQYVDGSKPDDSGDGVSWSTAERRIGSAIDNAIASGQPTRILVKGGVYPRFKSICESNVKKTLTAPITIESVYGDVITGTFDLLTYTKTLGQDFVYEAVRSNVVAAFNPQKLEGRSDGKLYKQVNSVVECNAQNGTFYTDNVTFYVHPFGSVPASDGNVLACLHATGASLFGNSDVYMAGIHSFGGYSGALHIEDGSTNTIVTNNCSFQLAISSTAPKDGIEILGCKLFAAFNTDASCNSKDGFNLHIQGAVEPALLTVNCTGFDNGHIDNTSLSNNGITVHDGLKAIDIGSKWLGSVGVNAGHIGDGTQVWHFGVTAGQSRGDVYNGGTLSTGAFGVWDGAATMWLDDCTDYSASQGVTAYNTAQAYIRDHSGTGDKIGNVTAY